MGETDFYNRRKAMTPHSLPMNHTV